jgi:hypothetical protein
LQNTVFFCKFIFSIDGQIERAPGGRRVISYDISILYRKIAERPNGDWSDLYLTIQNRDIARYNNTHSQEMSLLEVQINPAHTVLATIARRMMMIYNEVKAQKPHVSHAARVLSVDAN